MDQTPACNCGVSLGIRADHESQCAAAYLHKSRGVVMGRKESAFRVPLDQCVARRLYKLMSRNLVLGVFNGVTGFIGIREKFRHEYLFTEYHWDTGPPFGTVSGVEDTGVELPPNIELSEHSGVSDDNVRLPNVDLFDWLMSKELELMPEHRKAIEEMRARVAREDAEDDDDDGA